MFIHQHICPILHAITLLYFVFPVAGKSMDSSRISNDVGENINYEENEQNNRSEFMALHS